MNIGLPRFKPSRAEMKRQVSQHPLGDFFAWHDEITDVDVDALTRAINQARSERPIQAFLQRKPALLVRHLGGGHGRWVIPQKRLGAEHVSDFLIGDSHSFGHDWCAVELESPTAKLFNKRGDPSAALTHALRQIQDWRIWLTKNLDYAMRSRSERGLGLTDIHPRLGGYIILGRRADSKDENNALRRQIMRDNDVEIHTYDWLIDAASGDVGWFTTEFGKKERQALRQKNRRHE
jgi:hypothetical protein